MKTPLEMSISEMWRTNEPGDQERLPGRTPVQTGFGATTMRIDIRGTLCIAALLAVTAAPAAGTSGRAVSLNALASALKSGSSAQASRLCGITRVTGYLSDASTKDVILIGEVADGRPALHTDDFAVALRNAWLVYAQTKGRVRYYSAPGCSIDPDPAVLQELQRVGDMLGDSEDGADRTLDEWQTIGQKPQKVRVMGVPFDSRFAKVMVDADYYMKRLVNGSVQLGIDGFESMSDMSVRAAKEALASGKWNSAPRQMMNRFWFSPGESTYTEEDSVVQLKACRVRLLSEEEFLTTQGQVAGMGRPHPFAERFARGFTQKWNSIAAARPIYRELEGLFRMVAVARLMKDDGARCAGLDYLLKSHPIEHVGVSRAVQGLTSVKELTDTRETGDGTLTTRMWLTSCGGVSMDVRPKRISAPPQSKPAATASTPSPNPSRKPGATAKRPSAPATRAPSLKKTILSARKSPDTLSWDFPVAGGE